MSNPNPYAALKSDCLADVEPVEAQSVWTLTDSRDESVTIFTSVLPDGAWVYGYLVQWANGRVSSQKPTAELGRFRSQRDAKLYAVGFMLSYLDYFTEATRGAIKSAELSLQQTNLFT